MIITFWKIFCFYCQILCLLLFVFCYQSLCDLSCNTRTDNSPLVNLVNESWQSSTYSGRNYNCFHTRLSSHNSYYYMYTDTTNDDQGYQWIMFEFKQHIQLDAVKIVPYYINLERANKVEIWISQKKVTVDDPSEHCNAKFMNRFIKESWTYCGNTRVVSSLGSTVNCPKTATSTKMLLLRKFKETYAYASAYIQLGNIKLHGKINCPTFRITFTDSVRLAGSKISYELGSSDTVLKLKFRCSLSCSNIISSHELQTNYQVFTKPTSKINSDVIYPANGRNCAIYCNITVEHERAKTIKAVSETFNVYTKSVNQFVVRNTELKQGSTLTVKLRSKGGFPNVHHSCFLGGSMLTRIPKSSTDDEMISEYQVPIKKMDNQKELHCVFNQTYTDFLQKNKTIIHVTYAPETLAIVNEPKIWVNGSIVLFKLVASDANPVPTESNCQIQCNHEVYHLNNSQSFQTSTNKKTFKHYSFMPKQKWKNCKINCSVWVVKSGQLVYNISAISAEAKTVYYAPDTLLIINETDNWVSESSVSFLLVVSDANPMPTDSNCQIQCDHKVYHLDNKQPFQTSTNEHTIKQYSFMPYKKLKNCKINCSVWGFKFEQLMYNKSVISPKTKTVYYAPDNSLFEYTNHIWESTKPVQFNFTSSEANPMPKHECHVVYNEGIYQTLTVNTQIEHKITKSAVTFNPIKGWKNCNIHCWSIGKFYEKKLSSLNLNKTVYYQTISNFSISGNYKQENFTWIENSTAGVTLTSQGGFPEPSHFCLVSSKHWKQTANNSKLNQQNLQSSWNVSKITRADNRAILSCSVRQGDYTKFNSLYNHTLTVYYPSNLGNINDLVIDKRNVSFNVNTSAGNPPPEVTCDFNSGYSKFNVQKVQPVFHFNLNFNNQELVKFMSGNVTCKLTQKPVFEDQIWVNIITVDHVDQRKGNSLTFTLLGSIGSSILVLLVICVLIFVVIRMRNKNKSNILTQQGTVSTKINRQSRRLPPEPNDSSMQLNSLEKNKEVEEEESDEEEVEDNNDEDVEPIPENNDSESEDDSYWKKYGNLTTSEWLKVPSPHYYAELPPVPDWTGFKFKEEPIYDDMIGMEVQGKVQLFEEDVYET